MVAARSMLRGNASGRLLLIAALVALCGSGWGQGARLIRWDASRSETSEFPLVEGGRAAAIRISPGVGEEDASTLRLVAGLFAADVESVTGVRPRILAGGEETTGPVVLLTTSAGAPAAERARLAGEWESSRTLATRGPGGEPELLVAGSDRRGAAYALLDLSRAMGVSPWAWWANVPVARHDHLVVLAGAHAVASPSVRYRGIFLNDEDWGLRPWAAKHMDPTLNDGKLDRNGRPTPGTGNIGPATYKRLFELLLRLRANLLWPAMHPGTRAFNADPENAREAERWGIVMGASHSEALLRNNVGEWDEKADGPWNYQTNAPAIRAYWKKRVEENGGYENVYTVGMRGVHDSGLQATGSREVKARLVEQVMRDQQAILAGRPMSRGTTAQQPAPQVIWLYKESIDLYRAGMAVPDDVTLGWTDDNYGYLRELPNALERSRTGGSAIYYHVSYWGSPHDYLWLCTTPPALMNEELTKAFDHGADRLWVLNVGDLKPAESDLDYFLQLAWDVPHQRAESQREFLARWFGEQFPGLDAVRMAELMDRYYEFNFGRKPEFMGFNGYNDEVKRTLFNPLAWGDQNRERMEAWGRLSEAAALQPASASQSDALFELLQYPIEAAAAQNLKFLWTDRSFLDAHDGDAAGERRDAAAARAAYDAVQRLTAQYNSLAGGMWSGMMSAVPRGRHVFDAPKTALDEGASAALAEGWGAWPGAKTHPVEPTPPAPASCAAEADRPCRTTRHFVEQFGTVSIDAVDMANATPARAKLPEEAWRVLDDLGPSRGSVVFGRPGALTLSARPFDPAKVQDAPWLEYRFSTVTEAPATLQIARLPTFPVDSDHRLRYGVSVDGGSVSWRDGGDAEKDLAKWQKGVLRNATMDEMPLPGLASGEHTLRLVYADPGVIFEHLTISFPGAPPAYPYPPETVAP